ncbi:MAG: PhoH family protein [Lentisphaeria bacterium]|nr:PhoH family protein [Lentisphaeria bacterium]
MSERFYFEPGFSLRAAGTGDEVRLLDRFRHIFNVDCVARENWVELSGEPERVTAALAALDAMQRLFILRGKELDRADVEMILRGNTPVQADNLQELWQNRITLSPGKKDILPRSVRQREYLECMRKKEVVFGIGPAGTGKTYLAMAMAVSMLLKGEVNRIILTRPARESGEKLGFLPGSLEEKVSPYLRPLYDALYEMVSPEEAASLIARNVIEVAPLAFMRGRTLNGAFIILDEAQNTTSEQMLMFLTRMGFGSRCVITGDPTQSDLNGNERSGLVQAVRTLRHLKEIGFVFFNTSDVVRHALLEKIITAYNATPGENTK